MDVTTVADDLVVIHDGATAHRFTGLVPDTDHDLLGCRVRTLRRPSGRMRCRIGTVNDTHFGEVECGRVDDDPQGPIQRSAPGEPPYPETMNAAAADEIDAAGVDAVFVKGDVTADGQPEEWATFERCYRTRFGERLHVVRGNHDAQDTRDAYAGDSWIELPGVAVALLDTTVPHYASGSLSPNQIDWLDAQAADSTDPVIVLGHHQQWIDGERDPGYFGLDPDASDALTGVIERRPAIVAYAAGHTHRHRVRRLRCGVPTIEVGCVKDFPGTWAEYRVYDGGVLQVVHRMSSASALAWSERCRHLYSDFGVDYQSYALGTLSDRCFPIPLR